MKDIHVERPALSAILAAGPGAYAGIGSRETPDDVLALMTRIAERLYILGWTLRTGGAQGADTAFEQGVMMDNRCEVFLPWPTFGGATRDLSRKTNFAEPHRHAFAIAADHHPAWHQLSRAAQRLMARNTHQVLGPRIGHDISRFVVCWTPDGATSETTMRTGGTGQAIRIAAAYQVPVFNLRLHADRMLFEALVNCGDLIDSLLDDGSAA